MFKFSLFSTFLLNLSLLCLPGASFGQFQLDSTNIDTTTLINGLETPWEIKWGPDQFIWMTERSGFVSRVNPYTGYRHELLDISAIIDFGPEGGLLGMDFHPDFADTPRVYLAYNRIQSGEKQVVICNYQYDGNALNNPEILVDSIQGQIYHNGCRLVVSPDRKLFATTGDALNAQYPFNPNSLNGKILRYNLDGTIPQDNPVSGSSVWSLGHRNPQGLAFGLNNILYSSEHGPNSDDEFQIIRKGKNYGWPNVWGFCDSLNPLEANFCGDTAFVEPLITWTPTIAPSDIYWYDHSAIPEWSQTFLMAVLKDKMVTRIKLDTSGEMALSHDNFFKNKFGRIRDICSAPDGRIFLATNGQTYGSSAPASNRILILENPAHVPQVSCSVPQNARSQWIGTNSARLLWDAVPGAMAYVLEGRPLSSSKTISFYVSDPGATFKDFGNLNTSLTYAWRIRAICTDGPTQFSSIDIFRLADSVICNKPDSLEHSNLTETSVQLNWSAGDGALGYEVTGRPLGFSGTVSLFTNGAQGQLQIGSLTPGTGYEWSVRGICDQLTTNKSIYSEIDTFFTLSLNKSAKDIVNQERTNWHEVHPNPAAEAVRFKLAGVDIVDYNLYITDMKGMPVRTLLNQHDKSLTINLEGLPSSIYYYQIHSKNRRIFTGKFIKI